MKVIDLIQIERHYNNNGQHAEQVARFTLTGKIEKADNVPFYVDSDCQGIQIKSPRATICKGTNIQEHLAKDKATNYGYVNNDFTKMFIMTKVEYLEFATKFATQTKESSKNGGSVKLRLKDNKELMSYLIERVR